MNKRIADRGVAPKTARLKNLKVAFAVCGGIGSVESVKIIRELRRRGATVQAFMTPSALKFITPLSLEWATEGKVVVEDGPEVEHLKEFDLVVVAPATLNTITKSALGIADNVVLLLLASHIGNKGKTAFVPTMNIQMLEHPLFNEYRARLKSWGCAFFESEEDEARIKMPEPTAFADWVEKTFKGKK